MVLIAIGSRKWDDRARLEEVCDRLTAQFAVDEVWSGDARGADALAKEWAASRNLAFRSWEANWQRHRRGAGFQRTGEMIDQAPDDAVMACFVPGALSESRGSLFSVKRAERRSIRVYLVSAAHTGWLDASESQPAASESPCPPARVDP